MFQIGIEYAKATIVPVVCNGITTIYNTKAYVNENDNYYPQY